MLPRFPEAKMAQQEPSNCTIFWHLPLVSFTGKLCLQIRWKRATAEVLQETLDRVKGRSFTMAQGAAISKTAIEVLMMAQKKQPKTSQKLWFDQTTWFYSFAESLGGPKSQKNKSMPRVHIFGEILLQNLQWKKITAEVLLEKFYCRIFI